jgi:hypothetical protein
VKILTFTSGEKKMCGGAPKVDNSAANAAAAEAAAARAREEQRAADIASGQASINSNFSQFNDDFYNNRRDAYQEYATPQLTDQYGEAQKNLTFNLARGGNLKSQAGIDQIAKLAKRFAFQEANVLSEGERQQQALRTSVENERQSLFNQLDASANPTAAANGALTQSNFLSNQTPNFSPLGALFQNVALTGANHYVAGSQYGEDDRLNNEFALNTPGLGTPSGSGQIFNN